MCLDDLLKLLPDQQVLYVIEQAGEGTLSCNPLFVGTVAEMQSYPYRDKIACRDMGKIRLLNDNCLGVYV